LHRREQQTDQNGDDGDYHQQFHEGETASFFVFVETEHGVLP
jgi:hypothetical protein